MSACIPERIAGDPDAGPDTSIFDPSKGAISITINGSTPKAGTNGKIEILESEALQLSVAVEALGGFDVEDYQVRWCLSVVKSNVTQDLCVEAGLDCSLSQSDQNNKREGTLLITPGSFEEALAATPDRSVEVQLSARAVRNDQAGGEVCALKVPEKSVIVVVQKTIPAPRPEIMPAVGAGDFKQKCYTTNEALRAKIPTVDGYKDAKYTIRWYRNTLTGEPQWQGTVPANGDLVCDPDSPGYQDACRLSSDKTKKGDRWYVTAQVSAKSTGEQIEGSETPDPPYVDVCNTWPYCGEKNVQPTLKGDPFEGAHGVLRCAARCRDADQDNLYAKVTFENTSTTPTKIIEKVVGPFPFGGQQETDIEAVLDLGVEAADFAKKKNVVRCTLQPYSEGQDPFANDSEYPDIYETKDFFREITIVNTPPSGDEKQVKIELEGSKRTLDAKFTCALPDEASAYGDEDTEDTGKLTFQYVWRNGTTNQTFTKLEGANTATGKPFNPPSARELLPIAEAPEAFIRANEYLCCDVLVTDPDKATTELRMLDQNCVQIANHKPVLKPGNGTLTVSVQPDPEQIAAKGPFPECKDPNDPVPDLGQNPYAAQSLVCGTNGVPYDADGDEVFFFYTWFDCDSGEELKAGTSPKSAAGWFSRGTRVCCKVQACDGKSEGCGPAYSSPTENGIQIGNTPPSFTASPFTGSTKPTVAADGPDSLGDKYSSFTCEAAFTDCDAEDLPALAKTASYVWRVKTGTTFSDPYLNPVSGDKGMPAAFQGQLQCGMGQEIQCRVALDDQAGGKKESEWSDALLLENSPPEVQQVGIVAPGQVTIGSTIKCTWAGLSDPNGDPITGMKVRLRIGEKGIAGQETPDDPTAGWTSVKEIDLPTPGASGEVSIALGQCSTPLTADVIKGKLLSCDVVATDACGAKGARVSSVTPPNNDALEIVNAPPQFLAGAVSLSPTTGKKGTEYKCKVLSPQIKDCDPGEPESFKYVYKLKPYKDGTVQPESFASLPMTTDLVGAFPFAACPPESRFACVVEVYDASGAQLQGQVTSNTVEVVDQSPTISVEVQPTVVNIGSTLTCKVNVQDEVPAQVATIVKWYKNGAALPQYDGFTSLTLETGTFKKGDLVICRATADDGCTPSVLSDPPQPVTVQNTPPTFAKVDLTPPSPDINAKLICTPGAFIDVDGDTLYGIEFDWEVLDPSGNNVWTKLPSGCFAKEAVGSSYRSVLESPSACGNGLVRAGTFVRCAATGLDSVDATKAAAKAVISNEILVQNANPQFVGEVVIVPVGKLPGAPFLDSDQSTLECFTEVFDPDGESGWKVDYAWTMVPAGKDLASGIVIPAAADAELLDPLAVVTPEIASCDQIYCTAKLYNQQNQLVTQASSPVVPLRQGGSLRLQGGAPVVDLTANPPAGSEAVPGNPQQGYVELWYWPVALPSAGGTSKHVLIGSSAVSGQWDLRVTPGGVVRLRWAEALPLTMTSAEELKATIKAGAWHHLAVRWSLSKVYLYVNGAEAASWTTSAKPFDLGKATLGALPPFGPEGYLDELRVRSTTGVVPDMSQQYFSACASGTVAVYHFDVTNGDTVVDGTGHGFHGTFTSGAPSFSYHGQIDTCGAEACDGGCSGVGNCLLPPTKVEDTFLTAKDESASLTTYTARCTAGGSLDLTGGEVVEYLFEWIDADNPTGGNVAQYTQVAGVGPDGVFQEAKIKLSQGEGCIRVQCRATPLSSQTGKPGPAGLSKADWMCWSSELPAVKMIGFNCDDGTACTANEPNESLGCLVENDDAGKCTASCESYETASCVSGACVCKPKCVSTNPCLTFDYQGASGECFFKEKTDGSPCTVTGNSCAASQDGQCQVGKCQPTSFVSCDDANPCTSDSCDPAIGCVQKANTATCDDGNACTQGDLCINSLCVSGASQVCNDGNPCTTDSCNTATGCFSTNNTAACNDGNACTDNDTCSAGKCLPGSTKSCDDANPCTDDVCHPVFGCQNLANSSVCNDGSACTLNDFCSGGACVGAAALCNDNNPCTDDSCDPAKGCVFTANLGSCNDNNACTKNDACAANGMCVGAPVQCDDSNTCTTDYCVPSQGCINENHTLSCNDGNACTTNDKCSGGACSGAAKSCNDGNQCTTDSCDTTVGCVNIPFVGACDDGDACTFNDACVSKSCVGGLTVDCDDGNQNPCVQSFCEPDGGCTDPTELQDGAACNDGSACTSNDKCTGGLCAGASLNCDDGNPCTNDSCNPTTGCVHTPNGLSCNDGDACTIGDVCKNSACTPGTKMTCDDGNVCTNDSCDSNAANPATACIYVNNTIPCSDGSVCTINDQCVQGQCKGVQKTCADSNPCTDDQCNPTSGCFFVNNSAPCDDANPCTSASQCVNGGCLGTEAKICDDNNVCTSDSCSTATGCVFTPNTLPCDDGKICTEADVCANASCNGSAKLCNDANPCTSDTCVEPSGCKFTGISGPVCNDGNLCTLSDQCQSGSCVGSNPKDCNDNNVCTDDSCDPATGCKNANNGATCDDSNPCTTSDLCSNGVCIGSGGLSCDDGNVCTSDGCALGQGCTYSNNTVTCNDGNACTINDKCKNGSCTDVVGLNCDDGIVCTSDTCLPASGCSHSPTSSPCTDNNKCTTGDTCSGGACITTGSLACNDNNTCTMDSCDPLQGCVHVPQPGTSCNDGSVCTSDDKCTAQGGCTGTQVPCTDGNTCTSDGCDPATGCQFTNVAGTCDDNNKCTTSDSCVNGVCTGGAALVCNDTNVCTTDTCDPLAGCVYSPLPNNNCDDGNPCTVDDKCTGSGTCTGPLAYCCQPANTQSTCGYAYSGTLGEDSLYASYNPTNCGATSYVGGDKSLCLPSKSTGSTGVELCVDFPGGENGAGFLLEDIDDVAGVPSTCEKKVNKACTAVPAVIASDPFKYWLGTLDATTSFASARFHVRCPVSKTCGAPEALTCNSAVKCGATGWTAHANAISYGATCGSSAATGANRAFTFTPTATGNYTLWLGPSAAEAGMVIYAGPKEGACQATACTDTTAGTPGKPLHFTATANQQWCIYVEDPATANASVTPSVSCYTAFP